MSGRSSISPSPTGSRAWTGRAGTPTTSFIAPSHPRHVFLLPFFLAHLRQPLQASLPLDRTLILVVLALQGAQPLTLFQQLVFNRSALLVDTVTLDPQQIDPSPDDGLGAQQRQQLPVIQHAVIRAMAGQQFKQCCFLRLEATTLLQQRL